MNEIEKEVTPLLVKVIVQEKSSFGLNTGTYVKGGGEGSFELSASLKNKLLGLAENVEINGSVGSQSTTTYTASFSIPRVLFAELIDISAFKRRQNAVKISSYTEENIGATLSLFANSRNEISYDFFIRELLPTMKASRHIKNQRGHNVKSSLRWNHIIDTDGDSNEDSVNGRSSTSLQNSFEIAGIGFDSNLLRFLKYEVEARYQYRFSDFNYFSNIKMLPSFAPTLNIFLNAGLIRPWSVSSLFSSSVSQSSSSTSNRILVCDRFFVGGPSNMRGFRFHGVGPMALRKDNENTSVSNSGSGSNSSNEYDSIGGTAMMRLSTSLSFGIVPKSPRWLAFLRDLNLRGHVFADAAHNILLSAPVESSPIHGNTDLLTGSTSPWGLRSVAKSFARDVRVSCGVGLLVPTSIGNLELNYCRVVRYQNSDGVKHGIQFNLIA